MTLWNDYRHLEARVSGQVRRLQDDNGLHSVIDVEEHLARGHNIIEIVKRSTITSTFITLVIPPVIYRSADADAAYEFYAKGKDLGWDLSPEANRAISEINRLGLASNPYCVVIPKHFMHDWLVSGGDRADSFLSGLDDSLPAQVNELYKRLYTLPMGADYAIVKKLLDQNKPREHLDTNIIFPRLDNLNLEDLVRIRQDYSNGFIRMQRALKVYVNGISEFSSEKKLQYIIEEVDYECRKAEDEFKLIKRKHSRSLGGMLIVSSVIGVSFLADMWLPGIATIISTTLGSLTIKDYLSQRIANKDAIEDMQKSDYWFGWKAHLENIERG